MRIAITFLSGLVFGFGLIVSGLVDPAKVLGFLDILGHWNPSLAFTMGAAVLTTAIGYRMAFRRAGPILGGTFMVPTLSDIDARLVGGAALFGVGWGLVGFCPGPAVAALATGSRSAFVFVLAMLSGMLLARASDILSASALAARAAAKGGRQ